MCGFVARMSTNQWTEEFRKLAADDLDSSDISRVSCSLQRVAYGRRADILSVLARPQYPANTVKGRWYTRRALLASGPAPGLVCV